MLKNLDKMSKDGYYKVPGVVHKPLIYGLLYGKSQTNFSALKEKQYLIMQPQLIKPEKGILGGELATIIRRRRNYWKAIKFVRKRMKIIVIYLIQNRSYCNSTFLTKYIASVMANSSMSMVLFLSQPQILRWCFQYFPLYFVLYIEDMLCILSSKHKKKNTF